jgi:HSP20 family protein
VDPIEDAGRLFRDMNRLFDGYAVAPAQPALNVRADEQAADVTVALPGVDTKNIDLAVDDGVLTIKGERPAETLAEQDIQTRRERPTGRFERSIRLPFEVEAGKVTARYERGLLHIHLPRQEASKPRRIEITQIN